METEIKQSGMSGIKSRKIYLENYGCQMNFSDSEIITSIMKGNGFQHTDRMEDADVIFLNTCSIREHAEQKIRARLRDFKAGKKNNRGLLIGVLGCMAERLKTKLLEEEQLVDIIAGPDSYRDLPNLLAQAESGQKAVNVLLSREETYAGISPVRLGGNGISAFISIMRGCDNMCSFCVVPLTRGRERSRDAISVVNEVKNVFENGYREVTLLGQNVDSYKFQSLATVTNSAFQETENISFAQLLEMTAQVSPLLRIRFSTSHPKDMNDDVLQVMAKYDNICKYIHLPVQSGNNRILERMNRGYSREYYLERIKAIRHIIPQCGISTDIITGFCGETEAEHADTLSLMEKAGYDFAYMFKYSERPGTPAQKKYKDDVPDEVKGRRLQEVITLQQTLSLQSNRKDIGKLHKVLVEGISKRSAEHVSGRNSQNKTVIFPKENFKTGDYVNVLVTECTSATLMGKTVNE